MSTLLAVVLLSAGVFAQTSGQAAPFRVQVQAQLGANATLPCRLLHQDTDSLAHVGIRVKWTKVAEDEALNQDVMLSMGFHRKTYGSFQERVSLQEADHTDASLTIRDLSREDSGVYRCEVINGMVDTIQELTLHVESGSPEGVVFPYSPHTGRYELTFAEARQACLRQDSTLASQAQLLQAWRSGLDWCNAGWLQDGSVQYPITRPRAPCGGSASRAGLRSYGRQNRMSRFDVFCFATQLKGRFYWLVQPERLSFAQAVQACQDDGAQIAKVGHMYSAWKLEGYDRCDAGWLADGSVRYPISRPRKNCSPTEAAVRLVGFPNKTLRLYGVYCFRAEAE
ncbi:hyaluronan and proteoglycan link protein 1a [Synchiropus splendidus]|uniref:hyaluronan and proteoglycan link protein 1a n=1 Tax=Synchiropus splendidus TaxID=270530 RepID=UPI00237EBEC3|nr:hyaluronan and proteoglycan link protein 1a [Synchiropus splendidus]